MKPTPKSKCIKQFVLVVLLIQTFNLCNIKIFAVFSIFFLWAASPDEQIPKIEKLIFLLIGQIHLSSEIAEKQPFQDIQRFSVVLVSERESE